MKWVRDVIIAYGLVSILVLAIVGIYHLVFEKKETISPVEEIESIDSLIKTTDSIKLVIKDLDSIKNAKVIEVKTLDNDSTLKLFYELVKE